MQKMWAPLCQSDSRKICDGCHKKCPDNATLKHRKYILLFTCHFVLCSHSFVQWPALSFLPCICRACTKHTHTHTHALSSSVSLSLAYTLNPQSLSRQKRQICHRTEWVSSAAQAQSLPLFSLSLELRLQHGHRSSTLPGKTSESLSITNTKCVTSLFYDATFNT